MMGSGHGATAAALWPLLLFIVCVSEFKSCYGQQEGVISGCGGFVKSKNPAAHKLKYDVIQVSAFSVILVLTGH